MPLLLPALYTRVCLHHIRLYTHIAEVIKTVFTMWYNCVHIASNSPTLSNVYLCVAFQCNVPPTSLGEGGGGEG